MDIDIYQQCPCHSEKKIKFCCGKDIIGDLNAVLAKNRSGQPVAALDQIDRTIKKMGAKDCLLTIKTHILISNGEIEKAKETNELFLTNNPDHSTGLHHRALIALADARTDDAVDALQDAMDSIKGNEIPISLANAFRMIGVGLFTEGKSIAARAHLGYAVSLRGDSDPELARMLHESLVTPSTPLVLKQDFPLAPPPESIEWEKKYVNVFRALDRGQFRKGLQFLKKIDKEFPDLPIIVRGLAVINAYLGRNADMVSAWRRYGGLEGVSKLQAAEAESIAQMFDDQPVSEVVSIERVTFEISETEGVSERAISSSRMASTTAVEADPFEEGPAPRHAFLVLDRDKVSSADELTLDNVPNVIAEMLVYGKQTDRPARIEAVAAKDARYDQVKGLIEETFSSFIEGEPKSQSIGESNAMRELLKWRWHLPDGVTREQHTQMVKSHREHLLLEEWPKLSLNVLNGKSPESAAGDAAFETSIRALVMVLENASQGQVFDDTIGDSLLKKLGLSGYDPIEPAADERVSSPILQQYLKFDSLSEEQLMAVQSEAMVIGNSRVLRQVVTEALKRPDLKSMPRDVCLSMMAHFTEDDKEALGYLDQAREEAVKSDRPVGIYYVQEFEFRLSRGMTDGLPELLQTIQMKYLNDPDVEYQLVRVLDRFGIGPERGPLRGAPQTQASQAEPGPVWTPEQGAAPVASSPSEPEVQSSEEPSKLWIPD